MKAGIIAAGWGERLGQKSPKALTPVNGKALIDYALDGLEAMGATEVVCIVNEASKTVPEHVKKSGRKLKIDWIIQTTPSSMHSFLIVLERLAGLQSSPPTPLPKREEGGFLIATVDSVCSPEVYAQFARDAQLFPDADVCLGLTKYGDDENPLRIAMHGEEGTGLMPDHVCDNPSAFEILAMTNTGFDSEYVTAGLYRVNRRILAEKEKALSSGFTALRQYLGYLLKYGYRFYGVPLPPVIDVDRPQDVKAAEAAFKL
jgi:NDP-sugar pyrophosphorylase family protein